MLVMYLYTSASVVVIEAYAFLLISPPVEFEPGNVFDHWRNQAFKSCLDIFLHRNPVGQLVQFLDRCSPVLNVLRTSVGFALTVVGFRAT